MIAFDIQCSNGHIFEGWFKDQQAYEAQKAKGLIACPICNDTTVVKVPSSFTIKSSKASGSPPAVPSNLVQVTRQIVDYVEKNFDNVGSDFAREALKIHYGVSEPRNIRGVSTRQEEETLKDEGIEFFKIPKLPESSESES